MGEDLSPRQSRLCPDRVFPEYRHTLPPPPEGAGKEAGGRAGWGL